MRPRSSFAATPRIAKTISAKSEMVSRNGSASERMPAPRPAYRGRCRLPLLRPHCHLRLPQRAVAAEQVVHFFPQIKLELAIETLETNQARASGNDRCKPLYALIRLRRPWIKPRLPS